MSDPKLISPLLDGFAMGAPMSGHDGVVCCPAIKENSDQKYIVKVISVPASQVQMDALLLAGAYRDPADAMDYYRQVGEDVMKEAEFLKNLSKLEGFLPYEAWQMEPITSKRLGYQVYLVGSYKRSLEKYVRRNPVTHLEAVNLGLDLCAALSVCRQAGALYVDLKPNNVFMSEKKEYRIGDLGFIQMDALKYTALPDKYRSAYTPPELHDPMAALNLTTDTYALGMILYQLYNDGQLPFRGKAPETELPSPANADYELAEIIMKAIHPDPAQRWQDPKDMGHALAGYMQKNVVNDTPITPYVALETPQEDTPAVPVPEEEKIPAAVAASASSQSVAAPEDNASGLSSVPSEEAAPTEAASTEVFPEAPAEPPVDDSAPSEADADSLLPHEMSEELSRIMEKAEDLIAHETPEGVVLPEIPDKPDPFAFVAKNFDEVDDTDIPFDPVMEDEAERKARKKARNGSESSGSGKRFLKKLLSFTVTAALLAGLGFAAYWYYQNQYLQTIDALSVDGDRTQLTVTVDTAIDPALLTVTCADNYGNVMDGMLENGQVTFTDLLPNTMYRIGLEIEGFHQLVGKTSDVFTTDTTTNIVSFTAVTGAEDGSVVLNFTVDGEEPEKWTLVYNTEGGEEKRETFTGHSVSLSGLAVSKVYTFSLEAGNDLSISGKTSLEFMASRLILAENLTITSDGANGMTVHWNTPGDILVDSWNVRCYNSAGYEEQRTVTDTEVYFTGIDSTQSYTVEVTASGMTQPARASITAYPINISAFHVDESDHNSLTLTWDYTGNQPTGGFLVMYTVDGSDNSVVKCDTASAVISPRLPGADYQFTVQAADATSIFDNVYSYHSPEAAEFDDNGLAAGDMEAHLLKTPSEKNWLYDSMSPSDFTDQFAPGENISIVLHSGENFYLPGSVLDILYVIEDAHGNVLPRLASQQKTTWKEIWAPGDSHNAELNVPTVPTTAGTYKLNLYFNGASVASLDFTITE